MKFTTVAGIGVITVFAFVLGACGTKQQNLIAKVGDTPIDRESYIRRLEEMPTPVLIGGNQSTTFPAGYTTLTRMIQEQVLLQWAKEEGVYPSDQQVEARVQQELNRNPQLKRMMSEQRLTLDDFRQRVRAALAEFNLRTKGVTVTEEEIKRIYEQNKSQFYRPASVRVRAIQVQNPEVRKQIDDDLKRGFNFQSIVAKYSQNPVAGIQSGEVEYALEGPVDSRTPQGQILLRIRNVLKNTKPLQLTDWIPTGNNSFARFEVVARTEGRQLPLEEVRELIREQLMLQKGAQTNRDFNLELVKRIVNTPVEIYSDAWRKEYTRQIDELKKQIAQFEQQRKSAAGSGQPTQPQSAAAPAASRR